MNLRAVGTATGFFRCHAENTAQETRDGSKAPRWGEGRTASVRNAVWKQCRTFGVLVGASALLGCGGGGDNDQGIVFRALGFVAGPSTIETDQIRCTEPTVQNVISDIGFVVNLDLLRSFPDPNNALGDPCGGYIALQNDLTVQAMNVQEIVVRYEIPGAGLPIPENSITTAITVNGSASEAEASSGQVNLVYSQLRGQMIPEQFMSFLLQNENLLPAYPYGMNAYFKARGQSDNGKRYTSNEIGYQFTITR